MPALEASLLKPEHANVPLSGTRWLWRTEEPYPPLTAVLATPIFKMDQYEAVRARLRQPAPGQFFFCSSRNQTVVGFFRPK